MDEIKEIKEIEILKARKHGMTRQVKPEQKPNEVLFLEHTVQRIIQQNKQNQAGIQQNNWMLKTIRARLKVLAKTPKKKGVKK